MNKYLEDVRDRLNNQQAWEELKELLISMEKKNFIFGIGDVELSRICKAYITGFERGKECR